MVSLNNFNASNVEPTPRYDAIPEGTYPAIIIDSDMKHTKAGNGQYLEITFQIHDGPYMGRRLWARLNLINPNPKAVEIARAELSSICRAVGVMAPKDSVELHNIPLQIKVTRKKRGDTGEIVNEVAGYAPRKGADQKDKEENAPF